MQRRDLFKSVTSKLQPTKVKAATLLRPPYNSDEALFELCLECSGSCATACDEQIIIIGADKTPFLNLLESGCTFCDDCATACEPNVLTLEAKHNINAKITIDKGLCLSWNEVMCFSCKDPCLDDAIIFKSLFKPIIDGDKCTACGFCISRCPSEAIKVEVL